MTAFRRAIYQQDSETDVLDDVRARGRLDRDNVRRRFRTMCERVEDLPFAPLPAHTSRVLPKSVCDQCRGLVRVEPLRLDARALRKTRVGSVAGQSGCSDSIASTKL